MSLILKQITFTSFIIGFGLTKGCDRKAQSIFALSGDLDTSKKGCTQVSYWPNIMFNCVGGCAGSFSSSVSFGVSAGESRENQPLSPICRGSGARCCRVHSASRVRLHVLHLCLDKAAINKTAYHLNLMKFKFVIFYYQNPLKISRFDRTGEYSLRIANTILSHYNSQSPVATLEVVPVPKYVATSCTCSPCFDSDNPLASDTCRNILSKGKIQAS